MVSKKCLNYLNILPEILSEMMLVLVVCSVSGKAKWNWFFCSVLRLVLSVRIEEMRMFFAEKRSRRTKEETRRSCERELRGNKCSQLSAKWRGKNRDLIEKAARFSSFCWFSPREKCQLSVRMEKVIWVWQLVEEPKGRAKEIGGMQGRKVKNYSCPIGKQILNFSLFFSFV